MMILFVNFMLNNKVHINCIKHFVNLSFMLQNIVAYFVVL